MNTTRHDFAFISRRWKRFNDQLCDCLQEFQESTEIIWTSFFCFDQKFNFIKNRIH